MTVTVTDAAPVLDAIPAQTAPVGTPIDLDGSVANSVSTDPYAYGWVVTQNGSTVETYSGQDFAFNPVVSGTFAVALTVTDRQDGLSSTTSTVVTVTEVIPVVAPLPAAEISEEARSASPGRTRTPGPPRV